MYVVPNIKKGYTMDKLKPCPFCGNEGLTVENFGNAIWWICCANCDADYPTNSAESGAIEQWNTRPLEDALLEACEDVIKSTEILQSAETVDEDDFWKAIEQLRTAIARAKGEQVK